MHEMALGIMRTIIEGINGTIRPRDVSKSVAIGRRPLHKPPLSELKGLRVSCRPRLSPSLSVPATTNAKPLNICEKLGNHRFLNKRERELTHAIRHYVPTRAT